MKIYKWFRGLFKASALTTVMFIMQACYGTPHDCREVQISGRIIDKTTSLPIQGVGIEGIEDVAVSDENGCFSFYTTMFGSCQSFSFIDTMGRYQAVCDTVICDDFSNILIEMIPNAE